MPDIAVLQWAISQGFGVAFGLWFVYKIGPELTNIKDCLKGLDGEVKRLITEVQHLRTEVRSGRW